MNGDSPPVLVFTKVPGRSAAKTRLMESGALEPFEVERIAWGLLADTLALVAAAGLRLFLATEPGVGRSDLAALLADNLTGIEPGTRSSLPELLPADANVFPQIGTSFGARLENAVAGARPEPGSGLLIVGSDAPTVPAGFLLTAASSLRRNEAVLGPCFDGGVYAIGLPSSLPEDSSWLGGCFGDPSVSELEALTNALRTRHPSVSFLPHHTDVDVVDDLAHIFLCEALERSPMTDSLFTPPRCTLAVLHSLGVSMRRSAASNRRFEIVRR